MSGTIVPRCGVPAHRMGRWEDVVLGIWWCPDCREETWATEGVDGDGAAGAPVGAGAVGGRGPADAPVPGVRAAAADAGHPAGAPRDRAPGDGGARLWHLILDAFGRAAE